MMQAELVVRADMLRSTIDGLRVARQLEHQRSERLSRALEAEAHVAATLQHTMLPHLPASIDGVDVAARYVPADGGLEVGGDWYDVFEMRHNQICVVVGDVVGRGLDAAATMGQLRSAATVALMATGTPAASLHVLDRFAETVDGAMCATTFAAVIDLDRRTVTYSSAGHVPALVASHDGCCTLLDRARGLPLGVGLKAPPRREAVVDLAHGSILVFYTDGLVERRGETIDAGIDRLAAAVAAHQHRSCHDLSEAILASLHGDGPTDDDTALVVLRMQPRN
jgi:serine phosphatase RsbU (regulator of sigma subunit)